MYVIVWQFEVRPGCEREFERAYGADGDWAQFFRTGTGFVSVELLRDPRNPSAYSTIEAQCGGHGECPAGVLFVGRAR